MRLTDALLEAVELKALPRAGWVLRGVEAPESVAGHSWGVAWLVLALLPEGLSLGRALAYATLHDLPEVRTGDLTPAEGVPKAEKTRREALALDALLAGCPRRAPLTKLWADYEAQADPEARFVKQCDRLDMALQAVVYHRRAGLDPSEFLASAGEGLCHPALRPVFDDLLERVRDPAP